MFSNQPEVSTTSGSKVMAHYAIFTKVVTLTLIFIRFLPKKIARVLGTEYMSCRIFRKIGLVVWPVHRAITDRQTDKQTNRQTDERALGECILCKIGLTNWVIYLVDWQWQRSMTQSIGPNDLNEKCAMSRVLFGINIAAIQKICDLDLLHLTLTFFLNLWPWYLTLRLIYYYLDASKKNWCFEENKPLHFQSLGPI